MISKSENLKIPPGVQILADSGYQGLQKIHKNTILPYKRRRKQPLVSEHHNQELSSKRVVVDVCSHEKVQNFKLSLPKFQKKTPLASQISRYSQFELLLTELPSEPSMPFFPLFLLHNKSIITICFFLSFSTKNFLTQNKNNLESQVPVYPNGARYSLHNSKSKK